MVNQAQTNVSEERSPRMWWIPETTSTNSWLRNQLVAEEVPEGSLVVADFQTAGRGQLGNVWESEAGQNLTFSIVLYPSFLLARQQFLISQVTALSVKEALEVYVEDIQVKWPNDIYWRDRKICGMLIENDLSGCNLHASIIGIGINVNQTLFRSDAPNPVSLWQILGHAVDRQELLSHFRSALYRNYLSLLREEQETIRARYAASLYRKEGFHAYQDKEGAFEARIHAIEPTGHLLLALRNGQIRRYAFKEVFYV